MNRIKLNKGILAASGIAFLLMITPAWGQGLAFCGAAILILCGIFWKLQISSERIAQLFDNPYALAAAALVNCAFAFNFYHIWIDSNIIKRLAGIVGLGNEIVVPAAAIVLACAALPAAGIVLSYYSRSVKDDWKVHRAAVGAGKKRISFGKAFLILFGIYTFSILAVIRANYHYLDDLGRAAFGYKHWDYFGRFVSTALATLLHAGDYLVDISPIPQLTGMLFMATSAVLLLYIVYERTEFSAWELLAVVPLAVNPYFLECVSYRFDTPYMAVSMLFSVLPLLFRKGNAGAYIFAAMLGILGVCTSYQATTGVFPMLVVFLAMRMWNRNEPVKEIVWFVGKSVAGYLCGLIFFKMILMIPADAGYVSNSLPGLRELLPSTVKNLLTYYRTIMTDFKKIWLLLVALLGIGFLVSSVCDSRRKPAEAAVGAVVVLAVLLLLCFGIYPVLANTIFAPRAMYAFGALLAIFGLSIAQEDKRLLFRLPQAALCWLFLVFCFTYGNALYVQKEYTDFRVKQVIADLNDLPQLHGENKVYVQVTGDIGKAPNLRNMPQNYEILNRLVPDTFGGGSDWSQYGFYLYYDMKNVIWDQNLDLTGEDLPVIEEHMYHTIRGNDNCLLIELQ